MLIRVSAASGPNEEGLTSLSSYPKKRLGLRGDAKRVYGLDHERAPNVISSTGKSGYLNYDRCPSNHIRELGYIILA